MSILLLAAIILLLAAVMTTTGRGGGNFYVLALALSGIGMHQSATTGQFILVVSSLTATLFFAKRRVTDWKLIILLGTMTILSAFMGGFFSGNFDGKVLKIVFAVFITIASFLMLKPVKERKNQNSRFCIALKSGNNTYNVNLLLTIPFVLVTGFISGMVGISGGSFLVPLMVLAIGVPMHIAVGTSTALVMFTALAGFLGHLSTGHFDVSTAIPLAISGAIGAFIGTRLTVKINPKRLKVIFATTSFLAAIIMVFKIFF
jgi:hypothetical protein